MQEAFVIEDEIKMGLELFIDMRNQLIYGITTSEQYNISTGWGQRELISFLDLFLSLCPVIKDIAASCFEASVEFGNLHLLEAGQKKIPVRISKNKLKLFAGCFKFKDTPEQFFSLKIRRRPLCQVFL